MADREVLARIAQVASEVGESFDMDTAEFRLRTVARAAGGLIAYIDDRAERTRMARELAATVGMAYEDVALVVDVMRCHLGMPWQPLEGFRG